MLELRIVRLWDQGFAWDKLSGFIHRGVVKQVADKRIRVEYFFESRSVNGWAWLQWNQVVAVVKYFAGSIKLHCLTIAPFTSLLIPTQRSQIAAVWLVVNYSTRMQLCLEWISFQKLGSHFFDSEIVNIHASWPYVFGLVLLVNYFDS